MTKGKGVDWKMDKDFKDKVLSELKKDPRGSFMDLVLSDVLKTHGISDSALKKLAPEKKERIKKIANDIQRELEKLLD
jgi:hypothetical protein